MNDQQFNDNFIIQNELNGFMIADKLSFDRALRLQAPVPIGATVHDFRDDLGGRICNWVYGDEDAPLEAHLQEEYGPEILDKMKEWRKK